VVGDLPPEAASSNDGITVSDAFSDGGNIYPLEIVVGDSWYSDGWGGETWSPDIWYSDTWNDDSWLVEISYGDIWYNESWYEGGWYSDNVGGCCGPADPCDWANDGWCDCGGNYKWDMHDCQGWANDVYAIEDVYCDDGCSYYDVSDALYNCCSEWDPCNWSNDGMCDCKGMFGWDYLDCN